jgi:hypothetical protein
VLNPGSVAETGTFYISSTNGTTYAGNMQGSAFSNGTLTAVGTLLASGAPAVCLDLGTSPTITASGGISYAQGSTVSLNSGLAVVNPDNQNLVGASVTVATGDTLDYTNTLGIAGSLSSGTLTLTGTTTEANYQAALESITFSSTAAALPISPRRRSTRVRNGSLPATMPPAASAPPGSAGSPVATRST